MATFFICLVLSPACSTNIPKLGTTQTKAGRNVTLEERYLWSPERDPELLRLASQNETIEKLYFEDKFIVRAQIRSVTETPGSTRVEFKLQPARGKDPLLDAILGPDAIRLTNERVILEDGFRRFPFKPGHIVELSFAENDRLTAVALSTYEVGPTLVGDRWVKVPEFSYDPKKEREEINYLYRKDIPEEFAHLTVPYPDGGDLLGRDGVFDKATVSPYPIKVDHAYLGDTRYFPMGVADILRELREAENDRIVCDGIVYTMGTISIITQEKGPGGSNLNWILKKQKKSR